MSVKKEMRGTTAETSSPSPQASSPSAKRTYTEAEKNACSIEAMRNGGTCEACQ